MLHHFAPGSWRRRRPKLRAGFRKGSEEKTTNLPQLQIAKGSRTNMRRFSELEIFSLVYVCE
uniref:Uncharacterized protein n=1 Tax=Arundo donax TaxID=35708 RepID=A0A0A9HUR5_ARUDO